jgi:hypothetical protein
MALAASILRNVTKASPALLRAFEIVAAASASPSARITAALRSCSALIQRNVGTVVENSTKQRETHLFHNEFGALGVWPEKSLARTNEFKRVTHTLLGNLLGFNSLKDTPMNYRQVPP